MRKYLSASILFLLVISCSVQMKFDGASIDYTKTKTITIVDFPNMTAMYPPLAPVFNDALRNIYSRQTRLIQVPKNGDLHIEGEIVRYDITPLSVGASGFAEETKITVGVKVRFTNNKNHEEDFEETFTADRKYPSQTLLTSVQDDLVREMVEEITQNIYKRTVANW